MTATPQRLLVFLAPPEAWPEGSDPVGTLARLVAAGAELRGDLPRLAEAREASLPDPADLSEAVLLAPYAPEACRALLDFAGLDVPVSLRLVDLADAGALNDLLAESPAPEEPHRQAARDALAAEADAQRDWPAWYPVLRTGRCTRCGQCVSFCAFGVWRAGTHRTPQVDRPRNCKNLCPACARVCPVGAILFPRCAEPTVNGRAEPDPEAAMPDFADLLDRARNAAEPD